MKIPFLGGAYEGRSTNVSPQTCVNYFYEKGIDGESLVSTAGSTVFIDLGSGEVRGAIAYNGNAFFVMGNTLYEVTSAGTKTSRGTLNTSSGLVSMAHNGTRASANQQLMIVDGTTGYIYDNVTATLTEIADTDMVSSDTVVFLDGYFVFSQSGTDRFWISALYDGTTIDENDFATAEGAPDVLQAVFADRRDLFLFGKKNTEIWYNSGDPDNTFQRVQGGLIQTGLAAPNSISRFDNTMVWLSENERGDALIVQLGENYTVQIISSVEVSYQISKYTIISDAFSYTYQDEGHEFYVITFPTEKVTWVYDSTTQLWHHRGHTIDGVFPNRERYNCHTFAFGKHLFGDKDNGKVYVLDATVGTIDGTRIPRERTTLILTEEEIRYRISSVQLDMQEGIGDPNVSTDTSMWLSWSKDGGHTYSNEIERSAGNAGDYKRRVIWRRLGHARNWQFRLRTWTPNPHVLKGLHARLYGER